MDYGVSLTGVKTLDKQASCFLTLKYPELFSCDLKSM